MLPDILSAQVYVDAVASNYNRYLAAYSSDDPSTPLFQIRQIAEVLKGGDVLCGVYDDVNEPFEISLDNGNQEFAISQGNVRYNGIDYLISNSTVKYVPLFNTYVASDYYIATIYVDIKTLNNNSLINLTLSQPITSGDSELYVREKSSLSDIKIPFKVQIGNTLYQAGSVDIYAGKITLAASAGTISSSVVSGTRIYAIQEPVISAVYTNPFYQSGDIFISDHINKALLPQYALRLYDVLMTNPSSPSVVTTNGSQQIRTNFINFYGQEYDAEKAQNLANSLDSFNSVLVRSKALLDLDLAINNFNAATQQYALSGNVSDFWLNTPLLQPDVISAGVDLGRYKKFDFPDNYLMANKVTDSMNIYELLFAFDPVNYSNQNIYSASGSASNISATLLSNYGPASATIPSIAIHGVTATAHTSYPSSETPVNYITTSQAQSASSNSAFEVKFDSLNSNIFYFYTVYRKSLYGNLSIDLPLSTPYEISGDTNFGDMLPNSPTSGSQNYTSFSGTYAVLRTGGYQSKFALEFIPRLPNGSLEDKVYVGGLAITLSISSAYTGNATIKAYLVRANPTLSSYVTLGVSDPMMINKITTSEVEYSFKFNEYTSGALNLTPGQYYYILLELNNTDSLYDRYIYGSVASATGATIAQGFTGSWGYVPSLAFNFKTLGFVDNLSNSGSAINTALPPSSYVFKGVRQIRNTMVNPRSVYAYVPYFKVNSSGEKVTTYLSNDMLVRVVGLNTLSGLVVDTGYVTVPAGSPSGQKIKLTGVDLIDKITYISVEPGTNVVLDSSGQVVWGAYDYLLIIGDE